jgi:hypothetical protein
MPSDGVTLRHTQVRHTVESMTTQQRLVLLSLLSRALSRSPKSVLSRSMHVSTRLLL